MGYSLYLERSKFGDMTEVAHTFYIIEPEPNFVYFWLKSVNEIKSNSMKANKTY